MTQQVNGGAAFPMAGDGPVRGNPGMSLRDWFAGQALAGRMAVADIGWLDQRDTAERCYRIADAMLAARQQA